jgi:hypothetical protein
MVYWVGARFGHEKLLFCDSTWPHVSLLNPRTLGIAFHFKTSVSSSEESLDDVSMKWLYKKIKAIGHDLRQVKNEIKAQTCVSRAFLETKCKTFLSQNREG